ncbi:hypothetical protein, partial [Salmonella sp. s51933]|uniref:hypothetical protein n=1 Tax=Salmonella sp. s51933 TaxID=3160127 RepID=UPI003753FC64
DPYCCVTKGIFEPNICASNCISQSCNYDSNCAPFECCDSSDTCANDCSTTEIAKAVAGWIIAVIIVAVIVVVVIPVSIVICCCFCGAAAASTSPTARGAVFIAQPVVGTTIASQNIQTQQYTAANVQNP